MTSTIDEAPVQGGSLPSLAPRSVAALVARYLRAQGVERVYGLCGGHIQPLWDEVARAGIRIVDVRHEGSAVYMAHAESEITGKLAVALVTAGPGLTNALTAVCNADKGRAPVLVISGIPPRHQEGRLAMQDVPQRRMIEPVTRAALTVTLPEQALPRFDAVIRAALGQDGGPGPAYIEFAADVFRADAIHTGADEHWFEPVTIPTRWPDEDAVANAAAAIRKSARPLVIGGRGVHADSEALAKFLASTGAMYLDTVDSRGAIPADTIGAIPSLRGRAMQEADLIVTLDRQFDFQLAYGSPAVYGPDKTFIRIGRSMSETAINRRAHVEVQSDVAPALQALLAHELAGTRDDAWRTDMLESDARKRARSAAMLTDDTPGTDGRMHPNRIIAALNRVIDERTIVTADGGDILSFARVSLNHGSRYLDCGPLGCLGVGVPFAIAAALVEPSRRVVCVVGDGSFGFTGIELETAVRLGAQILVVVANNDAWNIERMDQLDAYQGNLVGVDLGPCRYDLMAQALGAHGERVENADDLDSAIARALAFDGPALVDVAVTRDAYSPDYLSGLAALPDHQPLVRWNDAEIRMRQSSE